MASTATEPAPNERTMRVELGWLEAPESDVAAPMASVRRDSRPSWVPTKRQVLVHVNHCLILWYCCIVFMVIGIRVDSFQDGRVTPADATGLLVAIAVLVLCSSERHGCICGRSGPRRRAHACRTGGRR